MAITTINDLTEIQAASANDVLPISTANGVKKIKASAIGGESPVEIIEIDYNGGAFRTVKTAGEIKEIIESGKVIIGRAEISSDMVVQFGFAVSQFSASENTMILYSVDGGSGSLVAMTFDAETESDVFTVSQ